jgi:hypothetical protein
MVIAQAYLQFFKNKGSRIKISHLSDLPYLTTTFWQRQNPPMVVVKIPPT